MEVLKCLENLFLMVFVARFQTECELPTRDRHSFGNLLIFISIVKNTINNEVILAIVEKTVEQLFMESYTRIQRSLDQDDQFYEVFYESFIPRDPKYGDVPVLHVHYLRNKYSRSQ